MATEEADRLIQEAAPGRPVEAKVLTTFSQKAWKKVALASVAFLGLAALAYHQLRAAPSSSTSVEDVVGLSGSSRSASITQCTERFQEVMDNDLGGVALGEFDYKTKNLTMKHVSSAKEAAETLKDPSTNFVHIGKCGFKDKAVVWLYPDPTGDPSSAFLMADGECRRLATQFLDADDRAECVAVYRVKSPKWGIEAMNHFHGPNTVTHAVVGGHGSDSTKEDGVLVMSSMIYLRGRRSADSMALVDALHSKLMPRATVFLDSCFAGINGIAKMFSEKMPEHWVMGGVVSLASHIKVHPTPFDGSPESGPTQVTSEFSRDRVIDPSTPMETAYGYPEPSFVQGLIIQSGNKNKLKEAVSSFKHGERMVAWIGGKNMGCVSQWQYPSKNGKVLKVGSSVKVVKPFLAFRMEASGMEALAIFPQTLPEGLHGRVIFCHSIGNAPTSGNCLIDFDLPEAFVKTDATGGAGQTLGALLTRTSDFKHLEVLE